MRIRKFACFIEELEARFIQMGWIGKTPTPADAEQGSELSGRKLCLSQQTQLREPLKWRASRHCVLATAPD